MMLFSSFGYETDLQAPLVAALVPVPWKWPGGQTTGVAARFAIKTALFRCAATPAICARDVVPQFAVQVGPCWLARGAPRVLKSTPDEPVLAFKAIVLLMMFTLGESHSEIPAPSHPATLSTMMLLVTVAEFHCPGSSGKATMSDPLTAWKSMPPPVPLSAAVPNVAEPAAIPGAQIAAHPVVVELVVVGAGADADATRSCRRGGEQLVAGGRVQRDIVVLNGHVHVMAVRQHDARYRAFLARAGGRVCGVPLDVRGRKFALADADTARVGAGVVGDPVVRDLQLMSPAVHEDAAATLRAVLDGQAVDARRVAIEVARVRMR